MGVLRWVYRRHRARAVPIVVVTCTVALVLLVIIPSEWLLNRFIGLSVRDALGILALVLAVAVVGIPLLVRRHRTVFPGLSRWLAGDESDPAAAWIDTVATPAWVLRTLTPVVAAGVVIAIGLIGSLTDPTWAGWAALSLGTSGALTLTIFLARSAVEYLLQPVLEDVAGRIPEPPAARAPRTVRSRTFALTAAVGWTAGLFSSAISWTASDGSEAYLLAQIGAVTMTIFWGVIAHSMFVAPILRPVEELTAGTERVGAGDYSTSVPLTSADDIGALVSSFNAMQRGLQERAALYTAFGTYVDPGLTERVLAEGGGALHGEEVEVTVAFVDVRDFTARAAAIGAANAVELLNELFGVVVPIVREEGGHANGFLGDGVLAVFGAPVPLPDHADRALAAAVRIQSEISERYGDSLRVGIGCNTGTVIAGTVGGGGKLEYTVIGDTVNVASRVEELTKLTGDAILLPDATVAALRQRPALVDRGEHAIRGKDEPMRVHAVAGQVTR